MAGRVGWRHELCLILLITKIAEAAIRFHRILDFAGIKAFLQAAVLGGTRKLFLAADFRWSWGISGVPGHLWLYLLLTLHLSIKDNCGGFWFVSFDVYGMILKPSV